VKLLAKLRDQLYSSNVSTVRQSAFNLSWMQEDGLEILEEALFSETSRRTKGAAAYGLRKMRGRMRKKAEEILVEGLSHPNRGTSEICRNALIVLKRGKTASKRGFRPKGRTGKFQIKEVRRGKQRQGGKRPDDHLSRRR